MLRSFGMGSVLLAAVLLVVCASGTQGLSVPAEAAPALRAARVQAAEVGGLQSAGLALRRCSQQLYLRGAGDDDEEAAEEGGAEDEAEADGEEGEGDGDKEDSDEGPMTITKSIKQVGYGRLRLLRSALLLLLRCADAASEGREHTVVFVNDY
jgi:hypothetical protein